MKKKQNQQSDYLLTEKKDTNYTNPFLIPLSIILAGVLIMVSILISATAILGDKVITKDTLNSAVKDAIKESGGIAANNAPTAAPTPKQFNPAVLANYAEQVGVNKSDFQKCYDEQRFVDEINKDNAYAQQIGLSGTPAFVIGRIDGDVVNGVNIGGAYPFDNFKTVLDAALDDKMADLEAVKDPSDGSALYPKKSAEIDDDPIEGNKDAKVYIIEFSDYECPFCKRHFLQTYPEIKKNYIDTGKVAFVFRDYIAVTSHNPAAQKEALAAECVKSLGGDEKYFKFHDLVFTNTEANGYGVSE